MKVGEAGLMGSASRDDLHDPFALSSHPNHHQDVIGYDPKMHKNVSASEYFRWWWRNTNWHIAVEIINGLVSALTVVMYVYNTYEPGATNMAVHVYLVASCAFSVEYMAKLIAATKRFQYMLGSSLIDLATIVFGFLAFFTTDDPDPEHNGGGGPGSSSVNFMSFLRMLQVGPTCQLEVQGSNGACITSRANPHTCACAPTPCNPCACMHTACMRLVA